MPFNGFLRRTPALCVLAVVAIALSPRATEAAIVNVDIYNNGFGDFTPPFGGTPRNPTINVGDTIRWTLREGFHDTINQPGSVETWNSGLLLAPGSTFDKTFTNVGQFGYYCSVHSFPDGTGQFVGMTGTITVVVPEPSLILGISAVGMALGGYCVRRWRAREHAGGQP
jgi:plastocyanin